MQNVSFNTVEDLFESLPDDELRMSKLLRQLVFDCVPMVEEKISYNVPFYRLHRQICFIWPATVLWGAKQSFSGVRFGFNYGYLMTDEANYLDKGKRKQVYWRDFGAVKEIDVDLLRSYLYEAALIDEELGRKKSNKTRS